ncbi:tetratricopeptide repeat protein [Acidocella sp.]|uniref:tetratricopeptide repeat protein n=1 Tax=Acidocella sp. TaxID=50710 RepID=UPI00261BBF9F|nr:tetratricopeptide repeat protein [Acidocella sp.]
MPDIFDEVAEDLRHDQAVKLARRYGAWLLGAAVAVLVGVGAQQAWQGYQTGQSHKAAARYLALTQAVDVPGAQLPPAQAAQTAQALNSFAATAPEGYRTLANLRAAGLYANAGNTPQAEALWTGVAQDDAADPLLRDLATLLWAQHALGTAPDADVLARLQPLTLDANPYHALARETQALTYLHAGNTAQAEALFTQLATDPTAPDEVRNRAQALLASLNASSNG